MDELVPSLDVIGLVVFQEVIVAGDGIPNALSASANASSSSVANRSRWVPCVRKPLIERFQILPGR